MLLTARPHPGPDSPLPEAGRPPLERRFSTTSPRRAPATLGRRRSERPYGLGFSGAIAGKPARHDLRTEFGMSRYFGMDRRQRVIRLNWSMGRLAGLRMIVMIVVAGLLAGFVATEIVTTATTGGVLVGSAESPE